MYQGKVKHANYNTEIRVLKRRDTLTSFKSHINLMKTKIELQFPFSSFRQQIYNAINIWEIIKQVTCTKECLTQNFFPTEMATKAVQCFSIVLKPFFWLQCKKTIYLFSFPCQKVTTRGSW